MGGATRGAGARGCDRGRAHTGVRARRHRRRRHEEVVRRLLLTLAKIVLLSESSLTLVPVKDFGFGIFRERESEEKE